MATAYKNRQTGVETLTARVFADGVEIHLNHRLRACTRFEWFHDYLIPGTAPVSVGFEQDFDVDLSMIESSGEYYCEISIGTEYAGFMSCDQVTTRERISIVNCESEDSAPPITTFSGGQVQVSIRHALFEVPIFSTEGLDYVTFVSAPPCAAGVRECITIATFTLSANNSPTAARRGQVSLTIGELVCYYNFVQNFQPQVAPLPVQVDPPLGAFITLTQDGPSLEGGIIIVTATTGIIGGTLDPNDAIVDWSAIAGEGGFLPNQLTDADGNLTNVWTNRYTGGTLVSATIRSRSNAFASASAQIDISFTPGQPIPVRAIATGATSGVVNCWDTTGQNEGFRVRNGRFRITGGEFFEIVITHEPNGALGTNLLTGGVGTGGRFSLRGPGVEDAQIIEPLNITQDQGGPNGFALGVQGFQITGITGTPGDFSATINGQNVLSGPRVQVLRITGNGNYSWGLQSGSFLQPVNPEFRNCRDSGVDFIGFPADGSQQRTSFSIRT